MDEIAHRNPPPTRPRALVVMGVSGSGKSVVGAALAEALGWEFVEGDQLHPAENIARMAGGEPLTDAHRMGWLDTVGARMASAVAEGDGVVAACSALKKVYRERLDRACPGILFVHLDVDRRTARARVGTRRGHFMPASLVDSQFEDLEPPDAGERAVTLDAMRPVEVLVGKAVRELMTAA